MAAIHSGLETPRRKLLPLRMHGICWKQSVSGMWEEHCGSAQGVSWEPTAITQETKQSAKQDLGKEGVERRVEGSPPASQLCQRVPLQPGARVLSHTQRVSFNQSDKWDGGGVGAGCVLASRSSESPERQQTCADK